MKIVLRMLYWIVLLGVILGVYWFGYRKTPEQQSEQQRIVPVEVETVTTGSIEQTVELTGWLQASQTVDIASKVAGRLESLQLVSDNNTPIPLEEGARVKKGQQIAVIDHDTYVAQVDVAKATVQARQVELADAEREKKRIIGLYEGGSATQQSRDKAMTAADLAAAGLSMAQANLDLALVNLRESTIVSPIDAVVTAKHIDQGNLIRIGDRIATIADLETVKVVVSIAEKQGAAIVQGTPARITVDVYPDKVFEAKVYSVYPALDPSTHTIQIEIRLDNTDMLLKPGMFARVTLITQAKKDVVVVPRDVVLGGKIDEHYVYVVEDKFARKRIVKLGIAQSDKYQIVEGLKAGEKIVVNGMNFLKDGIRIEIVRLEDIK